MKLNCKETLLLKTLILYNTEQRTSKAAQLMFLYFNPVGLLFELESGILQKNMP